MSRVMVVEDSFALRLSLMTYLKGQGLVVAAAGSAEEAAMMVAEAAPEVVVLDWNLPGASGVALLQAWRAEGRRWPVILLTARDAVEDRVAGLEAGANDYLVKPFANAELLARIRVQLRDRGAAERLSLTGCVVDLARGQVARGGEVLSLTTKEAEVLTFFSARPGRNVPREELLRGVWGWRGRAETRTADNTIARLRAKIEVDPANPRHLLTVHGVGYRFER